MKKKEEEKNRITKLLYDNQVIIKYTLRKGTFYVHIE